MGATRLITAGFCVALGVAAVGIAPPASASTLAPAVTAPRDGTIFMLANISSQTLTGYADNWGAITLAPGDVNYPVDTDELGSAGIGGVNGPGMQIMYLPNNEDAPSPYLECNPQNLGSVPALIIQFINIDNSPYILACQASNYSDTRTAGNGAAHVRLRSNTGAVRNGVAGIKVASYSRSRTSSERVTLRNARGHEIGTATQVIKTNRSATIKVDLDAATRKRIRCYGSVKVRVAVGHAGSRAGTGQRLTSFVLTG